MDNKMVRNVQNGCVYVLLFAGLICSLFYSKNTFAEQYKLQQKVDLNSQRKTTSKAIWLDVISIPASGGDFFVAQDNGIIYLANKENNIEPKTALNLPLSKHPSSFLSLTAMTIHPSFIRPEEPGYATLYTAHTVDYLQDNNSNRLIVAGLEREFPFETVITAWQFDFDSQQITPESSREVLRIPITELRNGIKNLTFDPFQKSWYADYGQLYFSLKQIDELKQYDLYSGVVLRIFPQVFGANNYTVSKANPFVKEPKLTDEIVILGAKEIKTFFWAKNDHASMFIQHQHENQNFLSKVVLGANLADPSQSNILWQQSSAMPSMLLYQGHTIPKLKNKLVFFTKEETQWRLTSHELKSIGNESTYNDELIYPNTLLLNSQLTPYQDKAGEFLLFDKSNNRIYGLLAPKLKDSDENSSTEISTQDSESNSYVWYILLLVLLALIVAFVLTKKLTLDKSNFVLEKDRLRLKYEASTQTIYLYKHDPKNIQTTLALTGLVRCEILLNDDVIHVIDNQPEHVIDYTTEQTMREFFDKEHFAKIVDPQTRYIGLILTDKDQSHTVCMYLRKGKSRLTSNRYYDVVDMVIDLCWDISKSINQLTEERVVPEIQVSRSYTNIHVEKTTDELKSSETDAENKDKSLSLPYADEPQSEVVKALDKLIDLHNKGYLSDEEFSLAKAKILK
jgi:hypothetical protein